MIEADEVRVTWHDSIVPASGWIEPEETRKYLRLENLKHTTVGHLIDQSEHSVIIAGSVYNGPEWSSIGDVIVIPKACIEKIENLVG